MRTSFELISSPAFLAFCKLMSSFRSSTDKLMMPPLLRNSFFSLIVRRPRAFAEILPGCELLGRHKKDVALRNGLGGFEHFDLNFAPVDFLILHERTEEPIEGIFAQNANDNLGTRFGPRDVSRDLGEESQFEFDGAQLNLLLREGQQWQCDKPPRESQTAFGNEGPAKGHAIAYHRMLPGIERVVLMCASELTGL
jgi:hypothetical protein